MPITETQRLRRKKHIGASDAPAIVGVDHFRNIADVYYSKINDLDDIKRNDIVTIEESNLVIKNFEKEDNKKSFLKNILKNIYIINFVYQKVPTRVMEGQSFQVPLEYELYKGKKNQELSYYLKVSEALILESSKFAKDNGLRLILVLGADRIQADKNYSEIFANQYKIKSLQLDFFNNYFLQFAKEKNIEYLDLLPYLKKETLGENVQIGLVYQLKLFCTLLRSSRLLKMQNNSV